MTDHTLVMIVPAGGEWLWAPMALDGAADAISSALGKRYRAVRVTDRLTALIGERSGDPEVEENPYLPLIGELTASTCPAGDPRYSQAA